MFARRDSLVPSFKQILQILNGFAEMTISPPEPTEAVPKASDRFVAHGDAEATRRDDELLAPTCRRLTVARLHKLVFAVRGRSIARTVRWEGFGISQI